MIFLSKQRVFRLDNIHLRFEDHLSAEIFTIMSTRHLNVVIYFVVLKYLFINYILCYFRPKK